MRRLASIAVTAGLAVSLTACAGTPFAPATCTPAFPDGSNAEFVSADGRFGEDPQAEFPTPLVVVDAQAHSVSVGDGKLVEVGDTADVHITVYDGETGQQIIATDYTTGGLRVSASDDLPAFGTAVQCVTVGSRVAAVGTALQLLGESAITANNLPVRDDDTLVLVIDVLRGFLGKADGADQLAPAGFPSVVLAPDGRPGFTFSGAPAPTELKHALLKAGNGAVVAEGDSVVVHYTGVSWNDHAVFDTTWDRGVPTTIVAADQTQTGDGSGTLPAIAQALIGQQVGSQLIVAVPPGSGPSSVAAGEAVVYVIDVLGIQ